MRAFGLGPRGMSGGLDAAAAGERLGALARSAGRNSSTLLGRAHSAIDGVEEGPRRPPFLGTPEGRVALERVLAAAWDLIRGILGWGGTQATASGERVAGGTPPAAEGPISAPASAGPLDPRAIAEPRPAETASEPRPAGTQSAAAPTNAETAPGTSAEPSVPPTPSHAARRSHGGHAKKGPDPQSAASAA